MNCLVCGHKLAIFRKLSLGDFCCQEHRALFLKEHNEKGLARLLEPVGEPVNHAATTYTRPAAAPASQNTRVYAQFLHPELYALTPVGSERVNSVGHGPLAPVQLIAPPAARRSCSRLASAFEIERVEPRKGVTAPIYFEAAGASLRLPESRLPVLTTSGSTRLRAAGLILPWSSEAGSQTAISLAPLVAAVWAQPGYSKPIHPNPHPVGALQFAWPKGVGKLELPIRAADMAPTPFAALEASQPGRVRLATPSAAAKPSPKLELALPSPAPIAEQPASEVAPQVLNIPAQAPPVAVPPQPLWLSRLAGLSGLFRRSPSPEKVLSAQARTRARKRGEKLAYDEVAPVRPSSADAWKAMLAGWAPSAALASGMFAVLFLFSAVAIFLSAPSELADRSPSWRWSSLRNAIRGRSVLRFEDDFRSGLSHWIGPKGSPLDWSYDQAGFLRPSKVGFFRSSMNLVNYRLELMGQIERKSLGWAFRAKDDNNYYVAKLTIVKPGPLPLVNLIHYPVTNGKEGPKVSVALPFSVRTDTLYQVEMNVHDDQFRASVNGHVVDSWSDRNLRAGGVGFVSGQGELARVRWIRVSDRDDVIGRVCSYLTAHYARPSDDLVLSASYYTLLRRPGL